MDQAADDGDIGNVCNPELVWPVRDELGGEIWKDRLIMIAVCRRSEAAANLWLEIVFAHQPADLLVVDDQALLTKGGSDTTPPVMFELITDSGHRLGDCCVVGR